MKKFTLLFLATLSLGIGQAYAADENQAAQQPAPANQMMAANCASNCTSCMDQCTKSEDCGVGFNCGTTPCGNRCQKQ